MKAKVRIGLKKIGSFDGAIERLKLWLLHVSAVQEWIRIDYVHNKGNGEIRVYTLRWEKKAGTWTYLRRGQFVESTPAIIGNPGRLWQMFETDVKGVCGILGGAFCLNWK